MGYGPRHGGRGEGASYRIRGYAPRGQVAANSPKDSFDS